MCFCVAHVTCFIFGKCTTNKKRKKQNEQNMCRQRAEPSRAERNQSVVPFGCVKTMFGWARALFVARSLPCEHASSLPSVLVMSYLDQSARVAFSPSISEHIELARQLLYGALLGISAKTRPSSPCVIASFMFMLFALSLSHSDYAL